MYFETSWDDGHELDLKLAELLTKYHLPGIFYITIDYVGTMGYLTWDQIRGLRNRGFEIGAHTVTHPVDMKQLEHDYQWFEIQTGRDLLKAALGSEVLSFCYPRGRYNQTTKDLVKQAGYVEGRTTQVLQRQFDDRYQKPTTIHWYPRSEYQGQEITKIARDQFDQAFKDDAYYHLWGHSWEIEKLGLWQELEDHLRYINKQLVVKR